MSNEDGSTTTPQRSTKYTERSISGKAKLVAYVDRDLLAYADSYCKGNSQSRSSLVNDLLRWLRDEA